MANEPNDDVFKNLAKVMEEIISSLPLDENARFVGCTIISGRGDEPHIFQMDDQDISEKEQEYEVVEGPDKVYITAEMASELKTMPIIDVQPEMVRICVGDNEKTIDLPCMVHAGQSTFNIKNGVLDIVCDKLESLHLKKAE